MVSTFELEREISMFLGGEEGEDTHWEQWESMGDGWQPFEPDDPVEEGESF